MKNELKSLSSGKEIIMTNIELKKLVERAKKKDNNAMEALYKEYYKDVLYVCSRYNMNPQDAEDITQDSFVTAFSSLSSLEDEEKFGSWISRIASNKCLNLLKRNNVFTMESIDDDENVIELPSKDKNTEDVVIDREVQDIISNMIQELPIEQRVTLFMFYYQDMSIKEIANSFNCSENTVKSRLNYAKKHMRAAAEKLENQGIKLRTIAVLPFLYVFFNMEKNAFACTIPDAASVISAVMAKMSGSGAASGVVNGIKAGKIAAIAGGTLGTAAVVAGVIIAVALGGKDNGKKDNKNEVEYSSAELVTTEKKTDAEETKDADEVQWVYDKDYKVDINLTEIKQFSEADFPELKNIHKISAKHCTRNTVCVTVTHNYEPKEGYAIYDTTEYLYNVNGERIDIGVDPEKEINVRYCHSEDDYSLNNYCFYDYIWVDEDVNRLNTGKLININGEVIIPAKYQSYILLSDNFVMALRGELGEGVLSFSNSLRNSDEIDINDYHDVIDVYSLKTGELIEELSDIDGNNDRNIKAINDFVIYYPNEGGKIVYDVDGNKVDMDKFYKESLAELGVDYDMTYEEIFAELNAEYRIKIGPITSHIEDLKGNVVSKYYNKIYREGDFFIIQGMSEDEYSHILAGYEGYGILDKEGNVLVDCILDKEPVPYGYDLWMIVYKGKIGFINEKGEIVGEFLQIDGEYDFGDTGMIYCKNQNMMITPGGIVEFGTYKYNSYINDCLFSFISYNEGGTIIASTLYDYMGNELMTTETGFRGWGGYGKYPAFHEYLCENEPEKPIARIYSIEIKR